MKLKIFQSLSYYRDQDVSTDLETKVNTWLKKNIDISIFKIESDVIGHSLISRVWYEEKV